MERVDPHVRMTLRIALYQILFLTRIPPHAAVNEAVEMARRAGGGRSLGVSFVNGLLRSVLRDRARAEAPPIPTDGSDPAPALALAESCPVWLVRRWLARFGLVGARELLAAMNRPAPMSLRVTTWASRDQVAVELAADAVSTRPSRYLPDFLVAEEGVPQRTKAFVRGELYIQDEASGLVARLVGAVAGDRILDACAAPGGKALILAGQAGPRGFVVAGDLHPSRLRMLRANAARLGVTGCFPLAADLSGPTLPFAGDAVFDGVVVDAPCSGTGVIRRSPELRYRLSPGSLIQLASLQSGLLSSCARLVRQGGTLVYSVCSMEPEEGPSIIGDFLGAHPGFSLEDPRTWLVETADSLLEETAHGVCLVTLPHRHDLDGFFAARLVRQR